MKKIYLLTLVAVLLFLASCSSDKADTCVNEDKDVERDCYIALALSDLNSNICEKMPEETNEMQGNKAMCFTVLALATHDQNFCRLEEDDYYSRYCKQTYDRLFSSSEGDKLLEKYYAMIELTKR
ncbi:hypothetical protein HYY69_00175 [Candidatus Woesearchaeota archaeon]|nr:hypothetical protein [Candidatus Woesearchaeota archaeon]